MIISETVQLALIAIAVPVLTVLLKWVRDILRDIRTKVTDVHKAVMPSTDTPPRPPTSDANRPGRTDDQLHTPPGGSDRAR